MPPGSPKFRRRKAERPDEIVAAALEIFAEKGFAAARLDDIAARAQVSKGAIYLYFATKEDIFRAVVEQEAERAAATAQQMEAEAEEARADRAAVEEQLRARIVELEQSSVPASPQQQQQQLEQQSVAA